MTYAQTYIPMDTHPCTYTHAHTCAHVRLPACASLHRDSGGPVEVLQLCLSDLDLIERKRPFLRAIRARRAAAAFRQAAITGWKRASGSTGRRSA